MNSVTIECQLGCCWTIAFINKSLGEDVFVWVCRTKEEYQKSLKDLLEMPKLINIIQSGPAVVK